MLAVGAFKADVGLTIIYAVIVGLPAAALAGPIYGKWISPKIVLPAHNPLAETLSAQHRTGDLDAIAGQDPDGLGQPAVRRGLGRGHNDRAIDLSADHRRVGERKPWRGVEDHHVRELA